MATVVALKIERVPIPDENCFRALMFLLDAEKDDCRVLEVAEASTAQDAGRLLCERFSHEAIAVMADPETQKERVEDAVQIGSHWVVWPDEISAVETAELLMEEDPEELLLEEEEHIPDETMGSIELPSLETLNQLSSSECALLILRALCTSDLTFFFQLLDPSAQDNIANECAKLIEAEKGLFGGLNDEQLEEAASLVKLIKE